MAAERITNFLKHGASPSPVKSVSHSEADAFVPSLVLAATDDPSIAPLLLFPLVSNPRTPKAMAYASLDYDEVRRLVLSEEMQEAENAHLSGLRQDEDSNEDWWQRDLGLLNRHYSVDECLTFEAADEINRAKIAVSSLRKSASEFYTRLNSGTDAESWWIEKCKVEGSLWSNEAFVSDILSMLPIAVSRCPDLLEPDILVKGLLTAKWGATLLAATLINNPFIQQTTAMLLADFLSRFLKKNDRDPLYPDVCSFSENTASYQASKDASQHKINSPISHCIQQACWVFVLLCQSVPQLAFTCREALVKRCTFADMVMHITVELLHDELEFFSRLIFSNKKTSEWILSSMCLASKEPVPFLPRLQQTKNLLNQLEEYFGSAAVPASVKEMEGAVQHVRRALITDAEVAFNEQGWRGRLHGHLRLYCVLSSAGDLQPTHEEVNFWLHALGGKSVSLEDAAVGHPRTVVTDSTLQLGIAFFCLVPGLLSPSRKGLYYGCVSSLLRPVFSHLASSNPGTEVGVWFVVQLLLQRYPAIAKFVRGVIGMDVAVNNSSIMDLCNAAAGSGIISDPSSVAKATAALRPQGPISSTKKNADLLLTSLSQLMLSGHFTRCAVDICEVVMHCISCSTEPLHPTLVQLVQMFAEMTSLSPWGEDSAQEFRMQPLPCSFLGAAIKPVSSRGMITEKERKMNTTDYYDAFHGSKYGFDNLKAELVAPAALTTFYIFCREQVLQNAGIYFGYLFSGSAPLQLDNNEYIQWSKLLATLPLRSLLLYMEDHWLAYEHLFPQWLSLASHMFPERLLVQKLLQDSEESDKRTELSIEGVPVVEDLEWVGGLEMFLSSLDANEDKTNHCDSQHVFSVDMVSKIFRNALAQPLLALRTLKAIQVEVVENKFDVQSVVINDLVPLLLEDSCARPLQKCFCDWWQGLPYAEIEVLVPQFFSSIKISSLDVDTNNSCNLQKLKTSLVNLNLSGFVTSYAELAQEPLALLACKNEVYHTPLLSVFLDILMELFVKNRRICLAGVSQGGRDDGLKHEEIMGALAAQESVACQILLEACLENPFARDDVRPGPMFEARQLICAFISSLLDTTPILLKLLHFQGYDTQLLPMMIDGVLVMVRCFEFVQELLQKAQESHFVVALIANLVRKYPNHPQSLEVAQQAVVHVKSLRINAACTADVLREMLEPVAWCAVTFPSLAFEVTAFLQSCLQPARPLEQSGTAIDPPLHDAAVAAFRLFIRQKVLPGRAFS